MHFIRVKRQVDRKLHDGLFPWRGARGAGVGKHLGNHIIALGQRLKTLGMRRGCRTHID